MYKQEGYLIEFYEKRVPFVVLYSSYGKPQRNKMNRKVTKKPLDDSKIVQRLARGTLNFVRIIKSCRGHCF